MRSYFPRLGGTLALCLLAVALISSCGSGDDGGESYVSILHGLKKAALSDGRYDAVSRAEDLGPVQKASLDAFCETNREMLENQEAWKASQAGYYVVRIKLRAERELPFVSTAQVNTAVNDYRELFGLTSFDPADVRRYARPCYR